MKNIKHIILASTAILFTAAISYLFLKVKHTAYMMNYYKAISGNNYNDSDEA